MKKVLQLLAVSAISIMTLVGATAPTFAAESTNSVTARPFWSYVRYATVNVRACASTRCRIVRKLHSGNAVHVYYRWGGWSNIGGGRWVASWLLTY